MNGVTVTIAFLPETFLLAGIVLLIGLEVCSARERSALPVSLLALILATAAAAWLSLNGYEYAAFPGHYCVAAGERLRTRPLPRPLFGGCGRIARQDTRPRADGASVAHLARRDRAAPVS